MKIKFAPKPEHPGQKPVGVTVYGIGDFEPGDTKELAEPLNDGQRFIVDGLRHDERFVIDKEKATHDKATHKGGGD